MKIFFYINQIILILFFLLEELSPKPELEDKLIPNWFKKNWK